jgi:amino acid adenylation domain-containing protein
MAARCCAGGIRPGLADQRPESVMEEKLSDSVSSTGWPKVSAFGAAEQKLAPAQRRQWWLERMSPGAAANHVHALVRLTGPLDERRLALAWAAIAQRHPALRARYRQGESGLPEISHGTHTPLMVIDATADDVGPEPDLLAVLGNRLATRVDLEGGPSVRAALLRLSSHEHVLCVTAHRIGLDEASVELLLDEFGAEYSAAARGQPADPATPAEVPDQGWWSLPADEREHRLNYWASRLGSTPTLAFPAEQPRPGAGDGRYGRILRPLNPDLAARVTAIGGGQAGPGVCAGLLALLARYTGQNDLVVGWEAFAESTGPRWVGDLGDWASLAVGVADTPSFHDLVGRVQAAMVDARRNRAPFIDVVRRRGAGRPPVRHPVFQVAVAVRRGDAGRCWPDDVTAETVPVAAQPTAADLRLDFVIGESRTLRADYSCAIFTEAQVGRLLGHLLVLLDGATRQPATRLSELTILSPDERDLLTSAWQGPKIPYSREPVHLQFQRRARERPGHVAAKIGTQTLTYAELDRRAGLLARELRARGIRREEIVGVALERSLNVLVAMVGILKAGGAFVMMDPTHPPRRLAFIIEDTRARVVLTHEHHLARLPEPRGWTPLCLDRDWPLISRHESDEGLEERADHDSLAYVLYTSGSTGNPKGVLVEHGPLSNFLLWMTWLFDLGYNDRLLQHMALIFDFALGEIFTALTSGMSMVLVPDPIRGSPEAVAELLTSERITYLGGPPAVLDKIASKPCPDLRYMILGGEAFTGALLNHLNLPGRRVVNGYGPTEAAVGCIYYECEHRDWSSPPPIGRAMPNRYAYVVDSFDQLAPVGIPGEVLVSGSGLARGYLNQPDLTADRFIADPFRPGERAYRTGDLGVWTEQGQIQFLGRIDSQVKLNGLRIELEEVESALAKHREVVQAAVGLHRDPANVSRLIGYVVPRAAEAPSPDALRAHLSAELPSYMIPTQFVYLDGLPLSPVGKVDRGALPSPGSIAAETPAFVPPRTAVERQVVEIFSKVLGVTSVSIYDNFFEIGGHSMALLDALARASASLGVAVPLAPAYANPTAVAVAALIQEQTAGEAAPASAGNSGVRALELLTEIEAMSDHEVADLLRRSEVHGERNNGRDGRG